MNNKKNECVMRRPRRWNGGPPHGAKLTIVQCTLGSIFEIQYVSLYPQGIVINGLHSFKVELLRITQL